MRGPEGLSIPLAGTEKLIENNHRPRVLPWDFTPLLVGLSRRCGQYALPRVPHPNPHHDVLRNFWNTGRFTGSCN